MKIIETIDTIRGLQGHIETKLQALQDRVYDDQDLPSPGIENPQ